MVKKAEDYTREALTKTGGDEKAAIEWIVNSCQAHSEVREAFGNIDRMDKVRLAERAREWVRKIRDRDQRS